GFTIRTNHGVLGPKAASTRRASADDWSCAPTSWFLGGVNGYLTQRFFGTRLTFDQWKLNHSLAIPSSPLHVCISSEILRSGLDADEHSTVTKPLR
ncbi:hypothetical protein JMJ77_0012262, partial [Colletotrichum scovillei]